MRKREKSITCMLCEFDFILNFITIQVPLEKLLKPNENEQIMALWNSIAEILWNVGEKQKVFVCLPGDVPHISHSHAYFQDNVTEKLWIFEFNKLEDLQIFIKRYIFFFTDDPVSCMSCEGLTCFSF